MAEYSVEPYMIVTPQRSKRPPIQPVWVITAAIATVVLFLLTVWRIPAPLLLAAARTCGKRTGCLVLQAGDAPAGR